MTLAALRAAALLAERALEAAHRGHAPDWARDASTYLASGACAREAGAIERPEGLPADIDPLVIVVGSSPSEGLLAAAVLKPVSIVLAHGYTNDGQAWATDLEALLRGANPDRRISLVPFDDADPVDAFRVLRERLRGQRHAVLDITGGRKSMSAAAFYLGVELGVPCVYLHGKQIRHLGRPEPGTVRIVCLASPDEALALGVEKQVRSAWERHQWETVADLLAHRSASPWLAREAKEASERARAFAGAMRAWERADYEAAAAGLVPLGYPLPPPADRLAAAWSALGANGAVDVAMVDTNPTLALAYIADAWRWVARRGDVEVRLRYLRFFALGEFAIDLLFRSAVAAGHAVPDPDTATGDLRGDLKTVRKWFDRKAHPSYHRLAQIVLSPGGEPTRLPVKLENWVPPEVPGHWHATEEWRNRRDACAHHLGDVREEHVTEIRGACEQLVLAVAGRLHELVQTPRASDVAAWFAEPVLPTYDDVAGSA